MSVSIVLSKACPAHNIPTQFLRRRKSHITRDGRPAPPLYRPAYPNLRHADRVFGTLFSMWKHTIQAFRYLSFADLRCCECADVVWTTSVLLRAGDHSRASPKSSPRGGEDLKVVLRKADCKHPGCHTHTYYTHCVTHRSYRGTSIWANLAIIQNGRLS